MDEFFAQIHGSGDHPSIPFSAMVSRNSERGTFMRLLLGLLLASAWLCWPLTGEEKTLPYKDPKLSIEDRVSDLLSRMTLEEKVAQISGGGGGNAGLIDSTGRLP
jgi:hypothetical protein